MAFTSDSVNVKNEVYSSLHTVPSGVMSPVQRNYTENTYISAKARAFTIDALLNTDKIQKKPEEIRHVKSENKTADSQQSTLNEAEYRYANDVMTPPKQQIYEPSSSDDMITYEAFSLGLRKGNLKYRRKHHSYLPLKLEERTNSVSNMHCQLPPLADVPYYSPMMSAGFFRPDECYSPMSFGGQSTPAGLKSYYNAPVPVENMQYQMKYSNLPTPNHSLTSTDRMLTPTDKHNFSAGGRKIISTRRQERPHPYLSTRQNFTTPDKSDTYLPITPDNDTNKTELTGKSVKGKRHRTAFTTEQLQTLEAEFEKQQYLVGNERCDLADSLNLTVSQVKVWFQNRRIKWRKEQFGRGNIQ